MASASPIVSITDPDFAARVVAERNRLAMVDPEGERDAVAPLPSVWQLMEAGEWGPDAS